jgi:hypothetical protein
MLGLTLLPVAVPKSAGITAICLAIASALTVAAKHYLIPKKYHVWVPNWNAIGLAFVTPQTFYPIAMAAGSLMNYFWAKRNPANFDMFMFPIAAGMLAGEGLGGVFQALLAVIGVDGGSKCFSWFDQNHAISDFSPLFFFQAVLERLLVALVSNSAGRIADYVPGFCRSPFNDCIVMLIVVSSCTNVIMDQKLSPAHSRLETIN